MCSMLCLCWFWGYGKSKRIKICGISQIVLVLSARGKLKASGGEIPFWSILIDHYDDHRDRRVKNLCKSILFSKL